MSYFPGYTHESIDRMAYRTFHVLLREGERVQRRRMADHIVATAMGQSEKPMDAARAVMGED